MSDPRPTIALYHHLPPGGADRAMYELVHRTRDDFRYVLYEIEPGRRDPFRDADRSPLHSVVDERRVVASRSAGDSQLARWAISVPSTIRAESRIARSIEQDPDIDIVLVHHQRFLQAPTLLRKVQLPSVYFVHEPRRRSFEYDLRHPGDRRSPRAVLTAPIETWARRLDIANTRAATRLLCNSDNTREYIWRAYGRDATVVRLGVDTDQFAPAGDSDRVNEVLAVGSLDPSKGHELAIAAVGAVPAEHRPALRIIHNRVHDTTRDALVRQAAAAAVDLVLEANVTEAELVERYRSCLAVLATARVEPLGLSTLEAMACGTPVIAVREGGFRETVIDGVTGILTDRTTQSIADAIERIATGSFSPAATTLAQMARHRFAWSHGVDQYRSALHELVSSG